MALKKWLFKESDKAIANDLAAECDIDPLVALLLSARGMEEPYDIESFLRFDQQLTDPFELPDMQLAVQRIERAIASSEKIAVCGDYDADGVTASALLYSYLKSRECDVVCIIPERLEEGYGLHNSIIERLHDQGVSLIITVDNGIGSIDEIDFANSLGLDVVVTDHHQPGPVLPQAVAVVDPHVGMSYGSFVDYAGVGVAFKLVCALENCPCEDLIDQYGDLVAIGTVADVVPLIDENRVFVQLGLQVLDRQERLGLKELIDAADITAEVISAEQIAFGIAPRINAAGRMGKSFRAFELLVTQDENEAKRLAGEICHDNVRRQDVESMVSDTCRIHHYQSGVHFFDRVIVIAGENWHHGVLGIVAARICAQFGKPTIVLSIDGEVAKGSARSIEGFDLFAALSACSDCLIQFGGHVLAAGITIKTENISLLREKINQYARREEWRPLPILSIDCRLSPFGVNDKTASAICCLAPYGACNPVPVFGLMNMKIDAIHPVGGGKSLRLTLSRDGVVVVCMKFGTTMNQFPFQVGDVIDLAAVFRYGTYKNKPAFSFVVQEVRFAGFDNTVMLHEMLLFERFMAREELTQKQKQVLLPERDDLAAVFRYIRQYPELVISPDVFLYKLGNTVSCGKLFVALQVFEEFGFIEQYFDGNQFHIKFLYPQDKFDLSNSEILFKLQS